MPPDFGGSAVLDCTGEEEQAKEVELLRQQLPRRLDYSTPISPSENRPRGGDELADDPSPADPRLGVVTAEEVVLEQGIDLRCYSSSEILLPLDCLPASEMDLLRYCLSWTWRKKEPGFLADGLQLIAGLDLRSDGEMDSPTHAGSTGVSLQRLSGQDGLMQAIDNTTSTARPAETYILTRTRRPCFRLWSCWFVLASVALSPLEVVATGRALAAAGH